MTLNWPAALVIIVALLVAGMIAMAYLSDKGGPPDDRP